MPWLTHSMAVDRMVAAAALKGWKLDTWWRDGDRLAEWWRAGDYPRDYATLVQVPAGDGFVAWCNCVTQDDGPMHFSVAALAPAEGLPMISPHASLKGSIGRVPLNWITQWSAAADTRPKVKFPVVPEQWVASFGRDRTARIAVVKAVDDRGAPTLVEISPGVVLEADIVAKRWFGLDGRDAACAAAWKSGRTEWPMYMRMLGDLAALEKKLNPGGYYATKQVLKARKAGAHAALTAVVAPKAPPVPAVPQAAIVEAAPHRSALYHASSLVSRRQFDRAEACIAYVRDGMTGQDAAARAWREFPEPTTEEEIADLI